jgi:hypothetical protein
MRSLAKRRYAEEKNYHRVDLSLSWPLRNGAMRHRGRYRGRRKQHVVSMPA